MWTFSTWVCFSFFNFKVKYKKFASLIFILFTNSMVLDFFSDKIHHLFSHKDRLLYLERFVRQWIYKKDINFFGYIWINVDWIHSILNFYSIYRFRCVTAFCAGSCIFIYSIEYMILSLYFLCLLIFFCYQYISSSVQLIELIFFEFFFCYRIFFLDIHSTLDSTLSIRFSLWFLWYSDEKTA